MVMEPHEHEKLRTYTLPPNYNNVGGGRHGMIRFPKHVWSPAGGWYCQPKNWKANTAICAGVSVVLLFCVWKLSSELETRHKMPEPGRFYPSRYWSRQIIEHEKRNAECNEARSNVE